MNEPEAPDVDADAVMETNDTPVEAAGSPPPSKRLKTSESDEHEIDQTEITEHNGLSGESTQLHEYKTYLNASVLPISISISRMEAAMERMASNQTKILDENISLKAQVRELNNQVNLLRQGLTVSNARLADIDKRQKRLSNIFRGLDDDEVQPVGEPTNTNNAPTGAIHQNSTKSEPMETTVSSEAAPPPALPTWNYKSEDTVAVRRHDANSKISDLLLTLREKGCLNPEDISKSHLPEGICSPANKCYLRYVLELIKFVADSDSDLSDCIERIASTAFTEAAAVTASETVTQACLEKIKELDGKAIRKGTIIGIGHRIRDYKNKIAKAKGVCQEQKMTADKVDIVEREEYNMIVATAAGGSGSPQESETEM